MTKTVSAILTILAGAILIRPVSAEAADKLIICLIDGARYSETFGDTSFANVPYMKAIADEGSLITAFYNDSMTYTSRAVPAIWCGTWTPVRDTVNAYGGSTQYAVRPTIFEYFRKQRSRPVESAYYVLKYLTSLWLPSYDREYGPDFWPVLHSVGSTDADVAAEAIQIMEDLAPDLMLVYFADVDSRGHSGVWDSYVNAVQIADSLTGAIWKAAETLPDYAGNTNILITNDHGRHDPEHGDFQGHGCGCDGCRHIMFIAAGPDIRKGFVSDIYGRIPDVAVTAASLLHVDPEQATGRILEEILIRNDTGIGNSFYPEYTLLKGIFPNPFNPLTRIRFVLKEPTDVIMDIFDISGHRVRHRQLAGLTPGEHDLLWNGTDDGGSSVSAGVYICRVQAGSISASEKIIYLK